VGKDPGEGGPVTFNGWTVTLGIAGLLVNGIGLGFLGIQVSLTRHRAARTQDSELAELHLRRKELTLSFLVATFGQRQTLRDTLPDDFDQSAVHQFIELVNRGDDPVAGRVLEGYLWYLETFALGVSAGIYDFETVLHILGARVRAVVENYRPFIEQRRRQTAAKTLYVELEALASRLDEARAELLNAPDWASAHGDLSRLGSSPS
jgi:hypothetical protein